jgi:hypothetical protein
MIRSQESLEKQIAEWGFLPFFRCGIEGFSIQELTPEDYWFSDERPGPWEWKGPVIGNWQAAYGKFYAGKAGYVSLEWLSDFINWRRYIHPLAVLSPGAEKVYRTLVENESMLSNELKLASGYSLSRRKKKVQGLEGYASTADTIGDDKNGPVCDALLTQLEMSTYVCIADFEYKQTKDGRRYGWGVARYCTPEAMYGEGIARCERSPQESYRAMEEHLKKLFPTATRKQISKILY